MARLKGESVTAVELQVQGHRVLYIASPASPGLLQDQLQGFQQMPCMLSIFYTISGAHGLAFLHNIHAHASECKCLNSNDRAKYCMIQ